MSQIDRAILVTSILLAFFENVDPFSRFKTDNTFYHIFAQHPRKLSVMAKSTSTLPLIDQHLAFDGWVDLLRARLRDQACSTAELAKMLDLSESNLYKRLRGQTAWTLTEFLSISRYFKLPLDLPLNQNSTALVFYADEQPTQAFDAEAYLRKLTELTLLYAQENTLIHVVTAELPVFYFFDSPTLLALKLFQFTRARHDHRVGPISSWDLLRTQHWLPQTQAAYQRYLQTPAYEVWGKSPLAVFLSQLISMHRLRLIPEATLPLVCQELEQLVHKLSTLIDESFLKHALHTYRVDEDRHSGAIFHLHARQQGDMAFVTFDNPFHLRSAGPHTAAHFEAFAKTAFLRARPLSQDRELRQFYTDRLQADVLAAIVELRLEE